jgi:ribosome-associated protein
VSDDGEDDDPRSARQIARQQQREDGERSARLAKALLALPTAAFGRLELDDDVRAAVNATRAIRSHIARRRAERALGGQLRRADLDVLEHAVAKLRDARADATLQHHTAERWRDRLIADGAAAAETFAPGVTDRLLRLIEEARREHETGRPRGARRALYRYLVEAMR